MAWAAVGAAAVTVVGGYLANKHSKGGGSGTSAATYDPYAPYRGAAATKLNALMNDPSSIENSPVYKADMQAASRTMAAQGYTGSGNALVAAANAGGQAYQQEFNNLAMLAGAGQSPAAGQAYAQQQQNYQNQQNNQTWGQVGNLVGRGIDAYNSSNNIPAIDNSGSYYSQPPVYTSSDLPPSSISTNF